MKAVNLLLVCLLATMVCAQRRGKDLFNLRV